MLKTSCGICMKIKDSMAPDEPAADKSQVHGRVSVLFFFFLRMREYASIASTLHNKSRQKEMGYKNK
jgi:hypothetical protein